MAIVQLSCFCYSTLGLLGFDPLIFFFSDRQPGENDFRHHKTEVKEHFTWVLLPRGDTFIFLFEVINGSPFSLLDLALADLCTLHCA